MAAASFGEMQKFATFRTMLQRQFDETKACLSEVDYEEHFDRELTSTTIMNAAEEMAFNETLNLKPKIIVLGQNPFAKSVVVNQLLNHALLPTLGPEAEADGLVLSDHVHWHSVRVTYGKTPSTGSCLPDCFSACSQEPSTAAPLVNLQADGVATDESVNGDSLVMCQKPKIIELHLEHSLLKDNLSDIRIPSCCEEFTSEAFMDSSGLPIVLYVIDQGAMTAKDIDDLLKIKTFMPNWPVLFIKYQFSVSDLPESERYSAGMPIPTNCNRTMPRNGWSSQVSCDFNSMSSANNYYGSPTASMSIYSTQQQQSLVGSPPLTNSSSMLGLNSVTENYQYHDYLNSSAKPSKRSSDFAVNGRGYSHAHVVETVVRKNSCTVTTLQELGFSFAQQQQKLQSKPGHQRLSWFTEPTNILGALSIAAVQLMKGNLPKHSRNYWRFSPDCISNTPALSFLSLLQSDYVDDLSTLHRHFVLFLRQILRSHLICSASLLYDIHTLLLRLFILTAFDMARDQMITPRRLGFARAKEGELYKALLAALHERQASMRKLVSQTVENKKEFILSQAELFRVSESDHTPLISSVSSDESSSSTGSSRSLTNQYTNKLQRFVLKELGTAIADCLQESFACLRTTFIGTISRCLSSLEKGEINQQSDDCAVAMKAFADILNAAYNIEISMEYGSSLFCLLLQKMKQVLTSATTPHNSEDLLDISREWKRKVAADTLSRLNDSKLAKSICGQLQDRLKVAHETFNCALDRMEAFHQARLTRTEDQRLKLRKEHAPRLSRLAMESLALRDSVLYGMPFLGPEIGRGQYGVVYSCEKWGPFTPCAVKSVVPPDDKHWNDLAMEFFYTKSLPKHDRIVKLHGAVIDLNYGSGGSLPAVLLIMERLKRDLYTAIRCGLSLTERLRIALDVVEGMRFLHSEGLCHRDLKLKNVLLDENNRGKITDLGFCKPEAMMSGSVVGTPVHMAPELFSGQYDCSVDVYAFGVLLWYICAGHVRLPQAFEQCASKDQLWITVRKGVRPEQLDCFDAECWDIMSMCWSGDPQKRPFLGDIQPRLEVVLEKYAQMENGVRVGETERL